MKYLLLIPCFFIATNSFSQSKSKKFSFKLGTEYELPRKTEDLAFFGNELDGIINLSLKKEELIINRFDPKTLNKTSEKRIDLPEKTRNFNSEEVIDFNNGNYFWLHSDWDKSNEREFLYYDKVDVNNGKISEANHKLFETSKIAGKKSGTYFTIKTVDKYKYDYDAEGKKLLISYRLYPESKNEKKNYDVIGLQVFDENLNKLWGGEFTLPYTEAIMDNSDFSVDSKGNAYLLAKVYDNESHKEKDKSTGKPAYHFEVMKFSKDSKKPQITQVAVDDNFIKETTLIENAMHEMIIACTYSKKSKGRGTDGIFLASLDQDGKITKYKNGYYEFPKEELEKFESARSKRKIEKNDDYEAPNLKVRNVTVESDGSVFIACEEYYIIVTTTYDYATHFTREYTTYYYEDMLGAKIDASGKFEWLRKIPKRQKGAAGRGTMSFKLISDASGYYFLYLDNVHNLNLKEDEVPKYHLDGFGGQVMVTKIDNTGNVTKELLFDTREEDIMIFPADFSRINGNQFIGRAKVKKNLFQPLLITEN